MAPLSWAQKAIDEKHSDRITGVSIWFHSEQSPAQLASLRASLNAPHYHVLSQRELNEGYLHALSELQRCCER